ncbi:MAG TPA: hypothetical protein VKB75_04560 [Jatrophihabitans sp.]|nr:hypothetical protein [Jatrophihabitans sp.]
MFERSSVRALMFERSGVDVGAFAVFVVDLHVVPSQRVVVGVVRRVTSRLERCLRSASRSFEASLVTPYLSVWFALAQFLSLFPLDSGATVEKDRGRETLAAYANRCDRADHIDSDVVCRTNDASQSNGASC